MKRSLLALLAVPVAGAVVFALGPRADMSSEVEWPVLPDSLDELERRIAEREAALANLREGTEKAILWADPATKARTPLSVVYLHGFSASRGETAPLPETLAARLGANLFYTRLTGHGQHPNALGKASLADWLRDGLEAYAVGHRLGERVVLVGTSMGGALATWLAARDDLPDLEALVLISPAYGLSDADAEQQLARLMHWPWGKQLVRLLGGERRGEPTGDRLRDHYWTRGYPTEALLPLVALIEEANAADFARIDAPVLVLYSPGDQVISPAAIEARFPAFGTSRKRLVAVEDVDDPYRHVLAGQILSPGTTERVVQTMLDFLASTPAE